MSCYLILRTYSPTTRLHTRSLAASSRKKNPAVRVPVSQHRCGRPGRSVYGNEPGMLRHAEMLPRGA
jgi:hypothetical protein